MSLRAPFSQNVTVAQSASVSDVVPIGGLTDLVLRAPTIDTCSIFILGGVSSGQEVRLFATDGSGEFSFAAATGSNAIRLASILDGFATLQIECGADQSAERVFQLVGTPR
jgi:hypothetical protein